MVGLDPAHLRSSIILVPEVLGAAAQDDATPHSFVSHSCSAALWNFQVRFGPAMTLR